MRYLIAVLIGLTYFFCLACNAQVITFSQLKGPINQHNWQLVINIPHAAQYHTYLENSPPMLVLNIEPASGFINQVNRFLFATSPVRDLISSQIVDQKLRIKFDLRFPVILNTATRKGNPNQLVLTLTDAKFPASSSDFNQSAVTAKVKNLASPPSIPKPKVAIKPPKRAETAATPVYKTLSAISEPKSMRRVVIVIDPGHGGKDPGATGIHGTHEKNIVLSISKKIQALINQQPGFYAVLTRSNDSFIPLRSRMDIARKDKADMFVAIHADAYLNHVAHGASVFALSSRGATSEAARWLAQRENQSELMGGVDLSDKEHVLRSVLINLSQTATIHASLLIGQNLLFDLHQFTRLHHPWVEQAAFVVLKSPDIPSLLIETGFISNPQEEQNLNNPIYQQKIAEAIMLGITHYFRQYSPPDTWLAAQHTTHAH